MQEMDDENNPACYYKKHMKRKKSKVIRGHESCLFLTHARLISVNGGIIIAIAVLLTVLTVAASLSGEFIATQVILFGLLALAGWVYVLDSASETLCMEEDALVRKSFLSRTQKIPLKDIAKLRFRHEGLNSQIGMESLTVQYEGGELHRISLGPCWRHYEIEAFLKSVEKAMGKEHVFVHEK